MAINYTSDAWYTWTSDTCITSTSVDVGTQANAATWVSWTATASTECTVTYTSTSITNSSAETIWVNWNGQQAVAIPAGATVSVMGNWSQAVEETQEQKAERLRLENEARIERERLAKLEQEKRAKAKERAEALALAVLPEKAKKQWSKRRTFFVRGQKGYYEVGPRNIIYLVDANGEALESWCCHPPNQYEEGDRVVATMLELLADEEGVIRKGNKQQDILPSERRRLKAYFEEQLAA